MGYRAGQNQKVIASIRAVARAYSQLHGFDFTQGKDAALRISAALKGVRNMECIFALCVALLFALGVQDAADESIYRPQ